MGRIRNTVNRFWARVSQYAAERYHKGDPYARYFEQYSDLDSINLTYAQLAQYGYKQNPWSYRCVNIVSETVAAFPWRTIDARTREPIEDHPMLGLFGQADRDTGALPLIEELMVPWRIGGEVYLAQTAPDAGRNSGIPQMLWVFTPDKIRVLPGDIYGDIKSFERTDLAGGSFTVDEMLQIRLIDPTSPYRGTSPIEASWTALRVNTKCLNWFFNILENAGRPSMIGETELGIGRQAEESANKFVTDYLAGSQNAGKIAIPPPGVKFKSVSMSPMDMGLVMIEENSRLQIFTAHGVPPEVVGDHKHATYSNYDQAAEGLITDTCLPIAKKLKAKLNAWLAPKFRGRKVLLDIDKSAIEALQENQDKLADRMAKLVKSGIKKTNEAREILGDESVGAEGDVLMVDANRVPLAMVTGQTATTPGIEE